MSLMNFHGGETIGTTSTTCRATTSTTVESGREGARA
jgi:hypothetical protein